jgi:CubicO group peptidase (beta-lactamase class C family)
METAMRRILWTATLLLTACGGGDSSDPPRDANPGLQPTFTFAPQNTGDGWSTSTPLAENLDESELRLAMESIQLGTVYPNIDALLVARHGRLVAEGYFNGFGPDTPHDVRSAGKSLVSAIVGVAVDQGLFGLDDPISQLIPGFDQHANMSDAKRAITVRHLLNMTTGLECNDWDPSSPGWEERMYDRQDWPGFILDLPMVNAPGAGPSYCTGGVVVLGHIVAVRSGRNLDDYANTALLDPLGMRNVIWRRQPDGKATGGTSMRVRPRDMAKLGQLYLDGGTWNGAPVISESWVTQSQQRATTLGGLGYGFLWWKRSFQTPSGTVDAFCADGNGGNFVFVFPTLDLVVTFAASNYNSDRSRLPLTILQNDVLTAVR